MANESLCSRCGGDATRCGCPSLGLPHVSDEERLRLRIEALESEQARNLATLRRMWRSRA